MSSTPIFVDMYISKAYVEAVKARTECLEIVVVVLFAGGAAGLVSERASSPTLTHLPTVVEARSCAPDVLASPNVATTSLLRPLYACRRSVSDSDAEKEPPEIRAGLAMFIPRPAVVPHGLPLSQAVGCTPREYRSFLRIGTE